MSAQEKQFYLYIDGQTVPVSEEVYREYRHYARKEEYFAHDLKRETFVCDPQEQTATFTPSREDSYDRLLEGDRQFAAQGPAGGDGGVVPLDAGADAQIVPPGAGDHLPALCAGEV